MLSSNEFYENESALFIYYICASQIIYFQIKKTRHKQQTTCYRSNKTHIRFNQISVEAILYTMKIDF